MTPVKTIKDFDGNRDKLKKYLKQEVKFKYTEDDRIITSNMVTKLDTALKGSFEAPNPGILDGPQNTRSINAYSVHLYKLTTAAGVIDTATHNPRILAYFAKADKEDHINEYTNANALDDSGFVEGSHLIGADC